MKPNHCDFSGISQAIRDQQQVMAEKIVARQYEQQPALWDTFGESGRKKSVRDAGYHLSYLAEAIAAQDATCSPIMQPGSRCCLPTWDSPRRR